MGDRSPAADRQLSAALSIPVLHYCKALLRVTTRTLLYKAGQESTLKGKMERPYAFLGRYLWIAYPLEGIARIYRDGYMSVTKRSTSPRRRCTFSSHNTVELLMLITHVCVYEHDGQATTHVVLRAFAEALSSRQIASTGL